MKRYNETTGDLFLQEYYSLYLVHGERHRVEIDCRQVKNEFSVLKT